MQHPEEGVIHAWLDGALAPSEAAAIESHIASCAGCAAAVADARGMIAASSRIVGHLDAVPANVIPAKAPRRRGIAWYTPVVAAAAALLLVVGRGFLGVEGPGVRVLPPVDSTPGVIRPRVTDSMPVARPPRAVEPTTQVAEQRTKRSPAAEVGAPSLPPANAAAQSVSPPPAPIPQKAAMPSAQLRADVQSTQSRAEVGRLNASAISAGGVAGGAGAPAPAAAADLAISAIADSAFVGCYEAAGVTDNSARSTTAGTRTAARAPAGQPVSVPATRFATTERFQRFALTDEPAPTPGAFAVREVDASGRVGLIMLGARWTQRGGRATVTNGDGETIVNVLKTDSTVKAIYTGGAAARVTSCRK